MKLRTLFALAVAGSAAFLLAATPAPPVAMQGGQPPATAPAITLPMVEDPTLPSPGRGSRGAVNQGWMNTHNRYVAQAKAGHIDLYMEGDSITDFWRGRFKANWDKNLGAWNPGGFGISGDRTQNVLYRIANGEFEGVSPKAIVLLIGTNNLASNATYGVNTVDDTVKGVKAVVDAMKAKAPQAKILITAIFPRNDPPPKAGPDIWQRICLVNDQIAKLDNGTTIRFININDKLADKDGKLLPGVMGADNLHPSEKGYQIWADAMKPILTGWLGAAPAAAPTVPAQ